jgi:NIMA (never in mitosis gene a)-related kinase
MHRDLKCANIFLTKDGRLKLGDLNVSIITQMGMAKTQTGTPYYCSPEIWKDQNYDYKCDIWSVGCILYELCQLHPPFRGTNLRELGRNVLRGKYLPISNYYSEELRQIISFMLVVEPNMRKSTDQLLMHPILKRQMQNVRKNIITREVKIGKSKKVNLMETIKLPRNLKDINSKLPKKRYRPENEMMLNDDEYETMKATFFQELKKKEGNNNDYNNNNFGAGGDNNNFNNNNRNNYIYNMNNENYMNNKQLVNNYIRKN